MRNKFFQTFFVFSIMLLIPGVALAHEGIDAREWLAHVASDPFGALDHILATIAVLTGTGILIQKQASRIMRYTGALIALAGLSLFLV